MIKHLALVLLLAISLPSCALFRDACTQTAAARSTATALIADAQLAIDQAEVIVARIIPAGIRHEAFVALDAARAALRSSAEALAGVGDACTSFDVAKIFKAFKEAWLMLEPFLVLFGGESASSVRVPLAVTR